MTWLVWRQHRHQAYLAAAALAAFAVLVLVTGGQIASQYHSALSSCAASHGCGNLANTLTLGTSPALAVLVTLTVVVPCLLGVFWGGPLVAREFETGTSQFAWMQSTHPPALAHHQGRLGVARRRRLGRRRLGPRHLVVQPAERTQAGELPVRPVRHPGHRPRRLRGFRGGPRHRRGGAAAPNPARAGHHHRRLYLPAPGDRPGPPRALPDPDHQDLMPSSISSRRRGPTGWSRRASLAQAASY